MYKVIGSDQNIYGPASAEQIRRWLAEGRVSSQTLALREGSAEWKPLSTFPEFAPPPPAGLPTPAGAGAGSNNEATIGFIFGVLSILLCWICCFNTIFAVLGVIYSSIGLSRAKNLPQERGKGLAMAGLILSVVSLARHLFFASLLSGFSVGGHNWPHSWHI